jgi:hypothetical protein
MGSGTVILLESRERASLRTSFFLAWHFNWGLGRSQNTKALLDDPGVVNREDLPREFVAGRKSVILPGVLSVWVEGRSVPDFGSVDLEEPAHGHGRADQDQSENSAVSAGGTGGVPHLRRRI